MARTRAKGSTRDRRVVAVREAPQLSVQDRLAYAMAKRVDAIDKKMMLTTDLATQPYMPSGLLALDLVMGRGYNPGMIVHFGAEASAKSTATWLAMGQSLKLPIVERQVYDAEGATDLRYTSSVIGRQLQDLFGKRNPKGGWEVPPIIRYRSTNITEHVFRAIHRSISILPDKRYLEDRNEWFLVFGRSREELAIIKELGLNPDKRLYTDTGKYWCSVGDDASPLGVFAVDSLPALVPEAIDEEETSDKAMAVNARALGKVLTLVRGKLRAKACILICVNQLRDRPGVTHGVPWYEPMGNVTKFSSDVRNMWTSRAPPSSWDRGENKGLCVEPSVEFPGRVDHYAFKGIGNWKNKYGTPFRKSMARVWVSDGKGNARGFDPVYDALEALTALNLIEGPIHDSRRPFRVKIDKIADYDFSWQSFKTLVLAEHSRSRAALDAAMKLGAPKFKIREHLGKMIVGRKTDLMIAENTGRRALPKGTVDLEADDGGE